MLRHIIGVHYSLTMFSANNCCQLRSSCDYAVSTRPCICIYESTSAPGLNSRHTFPSDTCGVPQGTLLRSYLVCSFIPCCLPPYVSGPTLRAIIKCVVTVMLFLLLFRFRLLVCRCSCCCCLVYYTRKFITLYGRYLREELTIYRCIAEPYQPFVGEQNALRGLAKNTKKCDKVMRGLN